MAGTYAYTESKRARCFEGPAGPRWLNLGIQPVFWVQVIITFPLDWRQADASDGPGMEVLAHGSVTGYGYAPTVIVRCLLRLEGGPEVGMSVMLEGGVCEDPTYRIIDVGEAMLAECPATVAMSTYCIEQKSLTQILYFAIPGELPSGYVLAFIATTPDFDPIAGVFADIVASFQPKEF